MFIFHPIVRKTILWIGLFLLGAGLIVGTVTGVAIGYAWTYEKTIVPGVTAFDISLSGLTPDQARDQLHDHLVKHLPTSFTFTLDEEQILIPRELTTISYDLEQTVQSAFAVGHGPSAWKNALQHLELLLHKKHIPVVMTIDRAGIESKIHTETLAKTQPVEDATLVIKVEKNSLQTSLEPEQVGASIDLERAMRTFESQAAKLNFRPIAIATIKIIPTWTVQDLEPLIPEVPGLIGRAPITLTTTDDAWTVTSSTLAQWIGPERGTNGQIHLTLDPTRVEKTLMSWLDDQIATHKNGTFTASASSTRAIDITVPVHGLTLSTTGTIQMILTGWEHGSSTMPIDVQTDPGLFEGPNAERLGVRELLGSGRSNFSGSPFNRRKNIALGAAKLNGILIPPETEFSLLKALGRIDGANGWFQELVIKGNKTTPEYGGGLCQVGTTLFRATMGAALPVTERRNHSYRVRYYEPAGTDATIYEGAPDYKFKNDTGHTMLLTTRIQGDNLVFSFWGTKDGRKAHQSTPRIWNIIAPPAKKIIETTDIPVGTTKCTEVAHAGATAALDYDITYPNGEVKKTTFSSVYRPWGAVCLVGVAQVSASGTNSGVDETGINNPN